MSNKIVRRPDFAGGGITDAEKEAMAEHVKLWTARAFRTEPADPEKLVPAIEGMYAAAGLEKPRVVIAPSPLVMSFAYGAAAALWQVRGNVSATRAATYNATRAATLEATWDATRAATDAATRVATDAATWDATRACFEIAGDFGLECAKRWSSVYQGGAYWCAYDAYLTACRDILGLKLPEHQAYQHWSRLLSTGHLGLCTKNSASYQISLLKFTLTSKTGRIVRQGRHIAGVTVGHCTIGMGSAFQRIGLRIVTI